MAKERNFARVDGHEFDVSYVGNHRLRQIIESSRGRNGFNFLGRLLFGIGDLLSKNSYPDNVHFDNYYDRSSEGHTDYRDGM
jgi:hypothetical protein